MFSFVNPAIAEGPRGRLHFLGIAYDEAPGPKSTVNAYDYAPDNFIQVFEQQSRELFFEIKADTLKGHEVTLQAVRGKLLNLVTAADKDDLVFLYWGTHGGTENLDWSANVSGSGKVTGKEIKSVLRTIKCPVVVVISTCGSGGFIHPKPTQIDLPDNVAAFCACRRNQSTNNELDVTLLEALSGFGDQDDDGVVTLKEALRYVPRRYAKLQRSYDGTGIQPVLGHTEKMPLDLPLTRSTEKRLAVVYDGVWYGAQSLEERDGKVKVRFLGWNSTSQRGSFSFPDTFVSHEAVDRPGGFQPIEVEWNGQWYPATILQRRGQVFDIHYIGYPDSDNETVRRNRVRFPFLVDLTTRPDPPK